VEEGKFMTLKNTIACYSLKIQAGGWWLTLVILTTQEAAIRRIKV
jgi:hypothetical protein